MTGRIHAVAGKKVLIAPAENTACFGCLKDCRKGRILISAENRGKLPLEPGQFVETEQIPRGLFFQGLGAVLPLALGFIAGYMLVYAAFPAAGEGSRAAGGALLLFTGGLVTVLIRRRHPAKEITRIKRIISACPQNNQLCG
jgi:hypothetical protein